MFLNSIQNYKLINNHLIIPIKNVEITYTTFYANLYIKFHI